MIPCHRIIYVFKEEPDVWFRRRVAFVKLSHVLNTKEKNVEKGKMKNGKRRKTGGRKIRGICMRKVKSLTIKVPHVCVAEKSSILRQGPGVCACVCACVCEKERVCVYLCV